jgi:hypothetical protein
VICNLCFILIRLLPIIPAINRFDSSCIPGENTRSVASDSTIYSDLNADNLTYEAFTLAYDGFAQILDKQMLANDSVLTIIDFSLPSDRKRLWVIDIHHHKVLENSLVAHGKASGMLLAESFSDIPQSHQSSLGFFITGSTYIGKHGYSLILEGIEKGINENARKRAIVFHGASYVSTDFVKKNGRLGRSFGCPALPPEQNTRIIDLIKDCSCVFIYSPDKKYLTHSQFITASCIQQTDH